MSSCAGKGHAEILKKLAGQRDNKVRSSLRSQLHQQRALFKKVKGWVVESFRAGVHANAVGAGCRVALPGCRKDSKGEGSKVLVFRTADTCLWVVEMF
jgi:hypothetical protein|eukprot:SAG25_NODE_1049_length_4179_cov_2.842157_1_plen_98_part_00